MFLFARIILDSVDEISIDEIRRELKAMPNDLNEAWVLIRSSKSTSSLTMDQVSAHLR